MSNIKKKKKKKKKNKKFYLMGRENFNVYTVEFFFFNKNVFFQLVLTTNAKKNEFVFEF